MRTGINFKSVDRKISQKPLAVGPDKSAKIKTNKAELLLLDSSGQESKFSPEGSSYMDKNFPIVKSNKMLNTKGENFLINEDHFEQFYQEILFNQPHKAILLSVEGYYVNFGVFTHNVPSGRGFDGSFLEFPKDLVIGRPRFLILYTAKLSDFNSYLPEGGFVVGPDDDKIRKYIDFLLSIKSGDFLFLLCDSEFFKKQKIDTALVTSFKTSESEVLKFDYENLVYHRYMIKSSLAFDSIVIEGSLGSTSHFIDVATRLAYYSKDNEQIITATFYNLWSYNLSNDELFA